MTLWQLLLTWAACGAIDLAVTVFVRERYQAKGYRTALDHVTYEAALDHIRGKPVRDARDIARQLREEAKR